MVTLPASVDVKCRFCPQTKMVKNMVSALVDTKAIVAKYIIKPYSLYMHTGFVKRG
ncbi:hypothetical protein BTN49_0860 [Candidatus Enterovibrio escicola]|uniref:Uncharacterized protein n=1 Tax=Candidatus Enterovibrio escicola TaxID=1927127 RepID=A0A2A5T6Q2_9GAMM|nr:hypothetical protein BTN49_0860 [Candidatus Enterovibrio escacola]